MKQRLLVAAVGVPLLIVVLVLLPPVATAILTAAIAGAAAWELLHTACRQPKLLYVPTVLCAALVVLAIVFGTAITATLIYAFFYVMFLFYMAFRLRTWRSASWQASCSRRCTAASACCAMSPLRSCSCRLSSRLLATAFPCSAAWPSAIRNSPRT